MRINENERSLPLVFDRTTVGQMWKVQIYLGALRVELGETGNSNQNGETRVHRSMGTPLHDLSREDQRSRTRGWR